MKWEINWKRLLCLIGIILVIALFLVWVSLQPASPDWKKLLPVVGIIFIAILLLVWIKWKCPEKLDVWKGLLFLVCCILVTFLFLIWISWKSSQNPYIRDMGDLLIIKNALEKYHQKYLQYPQSYDMPSAIDEFLPKVPVAKKGKPYRWLDNTGDPQKFCVWTELEGSANSTHFNIYFLASPCGTSGYTINRPPTSLDDCCELSKP